MGCHTWFYRPIKIEYEEAKQSFLASYGETLTVLKSDVEDPTGIYAVYPEWIPDKDKYIAIQERMIRMVEKGMCKEAVMRKYQHGDDVTVYVNSCHYIDDTEYHDVFRIGGYPSNKLFSLDETLKFVEDNKEKISSHYEYDDMIQRLKDFWDKYPNGMIDFG